MSVVLRQMLRHPHVTGHGGGHPGHTHVTGHPAHLESTFTMCLHVRSVRRTDHTTGDHVDGRATVEDVL